MRNDQSWKECPTAWFAVLERAIADGDRQKEESAKRELQRLGYCVTASGRSQFPEPQGASS
jgi:hypothetical protein